MTTIDTRGNLHSRVTGRFEEKANSKPTGQPPATLADPLQVQHAQFGQRVIQLLDGREWGSDTFEEIAAAARASGIELRAPDEDLDEAGDDGLVECPNCGERVDELNHWPKLNPPVSMCDSCVHNARRSGWEPGDD